MNVLTLEDIGHAFIEAGLRPGDVLCLHADSMPLAQLAQGTLEERSQTFFDLLIALLGPAGTLIVPTFTYSFTENEDFDVKKTPSKVGALTELFRLRPGVLRSRDPIFSFCAAGLRAAKYASAAIEESFGDRSVFAKLEADNALIACFGCSLDRATFVHRLEFKARVPYRYNKTFRGKIIDEGKTLEAETIYFVRDLTRETQTDLRLLQAKLQEEGLLKVVPVGRVALTSVRAKDFLREGLELIKENPSALIREGAAK